MILEGDCIMRGGGINFGGWVMKFRGKNEVSRQYWTALIFSYSFIFQLLPLLQNLDWFVIIAYPTY